MSEYASPWAAERLVAKDDGTPSDFLQKVRQQPFVVVLLDEIEKAAAPVFDMLLGVLDEGRLTDRNGRTTIFRSAIVILTLEPGGRPAIVDRLRPGRPARLRQGRAGLLPPGILQSHRRRGLLRAARCRRLPRHRPQGDSRNRPAAKGSCGPAPAVAASDALVDRLVAGGFDPRVRGTTAAADPGIPPRDAAGEFLLEFPELRDVELQLDADAEGTLTVRRARPPTRRIRRHRLHTPHNLRYNPDQCGQITHPMGYDPYNPYAFVKFFGGWSRQMLDGFDTTVYDILQGASVFLFVREKWAFD